MPLTPSLLFTLGMTLQPQAGDPGVPLRVMTYNIKHGQTNAACVQPQVEPGTPPQRDCNLDLDASAAVIRAHRPDIVGVQEVDRFWARSAYVDEPVVLAERTGLPHQCYAANLEHGPDAHADRPHQYGTLVLSRFPIVECRNTLLPREGQAEQRGLTLAVVDAGGVRLRFYNTHLHITAADRLKQTPRILEVFEEGSGPAILVGDFNARPAAEEMRAVRARFTDAWTAGSVGAGATVNPQGLTSPATPAAPPRSRIDYVFVTSDITVKAVAVPVDESTRFAADHYPVVAEVSVGSSADVKDKK